ncbi:nitroreductase family protein [Sphingobium sp. KCTC 72723]|jgi:nitroreductase|uniref:nitroreductase family protein n=1 Tax=Sphingobium sp. KCTC 72723 TaxID=2733867 RepID=UPI00165D40D0|nr:nitroreductase family protein [Sphingobium sp. KCTC 72723]
MTVTSRTVTRPVEPLFLDRWSPRAFDSSAIPQADLDTIFDGARWAPSAFNYQPWRFLYAHRDDADWARFLDVLLPFNQSWVRNAGALIFVLSDTLSSAPGSDEAKPSHSHSFDAGAAWALLALQATRLGYHTHAMTGVDFDKARAQLAVPERFRIEAAVAIGRMGDTSVLPEALAAREIPSDRKPVESIARQGNFVD